MKIPKFNNQGNLPIGYWEVDWNELVEKFGYNHTRKEQLEGLNRLAQVFRESSLKYLYVDGSFVTSKEFPGDIDIGINVEEMTRKQLIIFRNMHPIFTQPQTSEKKKVLKQRFGGDIILDDHSLDYINDLFCSDREGNPKGIIKLKLSSIS